MRAADIINLFSLSGEKAIECAIIHMREQILLVGELVAKDIALNNRAELATDILNPKLKELVEVYEELKQML